jgi:hypothetical protein
MKVATESTPRIGIVNTGAKNVPSVNEAIQGLIAQSKAIATQNAPREIIGSIQVSRGVDMAQSLVLARTTSGSLALYEQSFGLPGGERYRPIAMATDALTSPSFENAADGFEPLYKPRGQLKKSGYDVVLKDNQLYLKHGSTVMVIRPGTSAT